MIGTSLGAYIFIRSCIFFLHWIAPLSILCSISSLFTTSPFYHTRLGRALQIWAAIETAFYLFIYHPRKIYLQRPATHPELVTRDQRRILFQRCHDNIPNPEQYLAKWLMHAPISEIKRENVKEFLRWAFLNADQLKETDEEEVNEYVHELEMMLGRKIEPGRGNATSLRLTLDKVDMMHRSVTWYLCVGVVDTIAFGYMCWHSFHFHRLSLSRFFTVFPFRPLGLLTTYVSPAKTLTYWHRPHTSKSRLPVLFIHGIGIGLYPYVNFLAELNQDREQGEDDGQVGIIAVEIMPISFRITGEPLQKAAMCQEIDSILKKHGWDKFVLVSHSYGSVLSTHLLHTPHIAHKIGSILLIDPVTFLLHLPDVAYNFICRKPIHANEHQLHYFASKDMGVSHTLSRHFFWSENILWKEDIADQCVTVVLGGRDLIVNTAAVKAYLTDKSGANEKSVSHDGGQWKGEGLDVLWFPELDHAQTFDRKRTRKMLGDVVRSYCARG
ncbi:hypothetical protein K504DRAFT_375519 [Pleomassaria siparia CBS 279.74]|uniref:AB hydrolase-1 domain-containing protein n=1 Tax=Pleomassaria siparia CBS 279.74 TaxID=1314801 RepID=A0A6G1KDC9_9PLEO|nr:hypothetical protein K504DRAFT_375519 [Pleomassaria siparia CBS 279.74]